MTEAVYAILLILVGVVWWLSRGKSVAEDRAAVESDRAAGLEAILIEERVSRAAAEQVRNRLLSDKWAREIEAAKDVTDAKTAAALLRNLGTRLRDSNGSGSGSDPAN